MPITVQELRNLLTLDDAPYMAASKRVQADFAGLEAKAAAMAAAVGSAFFGMGPSLEPVIVALQSVEGKIAQLVEITGAGFESMTEEITVSMAQAAEASQVALAEINASVIRTAETAGAGFQELGTAMQGSILGASEGIQSSIGAASASIQTALGEIQVSSAATAEGIAGLGAVAAQTGPQIATAFASSGAGLAGLSVSITGTGASLEGLKGQIVSNRVALAEYDAQILAARQSLAAAQAEQIRMTEALGAGAVGAKVDAAAFREYTLATETASAASIESQAAIARLTVEKQALSVETRQLVAQLAFEKVAAQQAAIASTEQAGALAGTGAATEQLNFQMRRHIATMEGSVVGMRGMGMNLAFLSEMFGATSLVAFVLFGAVAIGITKLLELALASRKAVDIGKELLESDFLLAAAFDQLATATSGASNAVSNQADQYHRLLATNVTPLISLYIDRHRELEKAIEGVVDAQIANEGSAKLLTSQTMLAGEAMAGDILILRTGVAAIEDSTAAREKEEKAVTKAADVLTTYRDRMGLSTAAVLDMVQASGAGEAAIARLAAEMDAGAVSARRFAEAWSAARKAPTFDLSGTTHGLEKMFETATQGANQAIGKFRNFGEEVSANEKNLKPLTSALQDYAKVQAAAAGKTGDAATIANIAKGKLAELAASHDYLGVRIQNQIGILEQSTKKVTEHGTAHRAAVPHVKALTVALDEQGRMLKGLADATAKIVESIEKPFRDQKIGQILHDKIAPFVTEFQNKVKALSDTLDTSLIPALQGVTVQTVDFIGNARLGAFFQSWADGIKAAHQGLIDLKAAVLHLKEALANDPIFSALKMEDETAHAFDGIINVVQSHGERLGLTQDQINADILQRIHEFGARNAGEYAAAAELATTAFKKAMDKLPGALDEIFNKLALGAKHQVAGLFQIIDSIPGKFGDAFRKSTDEVTKWVNQIDGILKGLHKIFQSIPDGLAGVLQSVIGLFKKTNDSVAQATKSFSTTAENLFDNLATASAGAASSGGGKVGTSFTSGFVSKLALIGSGLATYFGTRNANGAVTASSLAGSIAAGAQMGAAFGGGFGAAAGAAIGAAVGGWHSDSKLVRFFTGGIISLIFGGKSDAQKAAEAAQAKQIKDQQIIAGESAIQAVEATKQSMLDTASKIRDLLESITFYTSVPKNAFKAFFADLDKLMKAFAEHAKNWLTDSSDKIKVFADDMKIITEGIGGAVLALTALGPYPGIAEKYITRFGDDLSLLIDKISAVGDTFTRKGLRTARKFAEQIGDVVSVVANAILAFAGTKDTPGLAQYQRVPLEVFDLFAADLQLAVQKMGEIAGQIDNGMLKQANFFAEKTQAVVDVIAGAMLAFLGGPNGPGLAQFAAIPGEVMDAFFTAFLAVTNKMAELTNTIDTTVLAQAEMVAEKSLAIFKAIKDGAEAFAALRDYKSIAQESIDAILSDFKRAIVLLNLLLLDATEFESKAKTFDSIVTSGAAFLAHGMTTFVGSFTDMAAKLLQLPSGGTSLTPGPGFGSVGGMSTQSLSPSMSTQSHTTYINFGDLNIPADSTAGQLIKQLVQELAGIATGGMSRDPLLS